MEILFVIGFIILMCVLMSKKEGQDYINSCGVDLRKDRKYWTEEEKRKFGEYCDNKRKAEKAKYQDMADKHNAKVLNDLFNKPGVVVTKINGKDVNSSLSTTTTAPTFKEEKPKRDYTPSTSWLDNDN